MDGHRGCGYSVMTSASGNEAVGKGHAISYVKDCPSGLRKKREATTGNASAVGRLFGIVLGKFVRYIESS